MKKIAAIILLVLSLSTVLSGTAIAANKEDFRAGRIIDDFVFYNSNSMSVNQIQTFLESKVPNCDYNGTQSASDWGYPNITHAKLAEYKRNGTNGFQKDSGFHAPPYKCLRAYTQNTPQMEAASGLCEGLSAGANRSAAQIIKDVSMACSINPQVLIVLLEKEQSLVTDNWPLNRQLQHATGFACPDTAPCNPEFEGFFYQVYYAARQFKIYQAYPDRYNYVAGRTQAILWSPTTSCGSGQVHIENQATAGLYIYTPYQPNAAALNNLYGSGDSCSAYGNRNFWRIFTDWFGSTYGEQEGTPLVSKATNTLIAGSELKSGEFLTSPSGRYILVMHPSGQLIMYKSQQAVWRSGSTNWIQKGASLLFQHDGNVVIYKDRSALWATSTSGTPATRLVLQNDGNLVVYGSSNQVLWTSGTSEPFSALNLVGSSLAIKGRLSANDYLRSPDWRYYLVMQADGNLVMYTAGHTQAIWSSQTYGKGAKYASLQADGNLVVYSDKGVIWATGTDGHVQVASLNMQSDGNLVLYTTLNRPLWATGTDGKGGKFVTMQSDGNLVLYGSKGALWATGTDSRGGTHVSLQADGNFVMYGSKGALWATGTDERVQSSVPFECTHTDRLNIGNRLNTGESICSTNKLYTLLFQADGNLVLYGRKTSAPWASNTDGIFFRSNLKL